MSVFFCIRLFLFRKQNGSVTNKINVFSVLKRLITNPKVVTYGLLIGGANGVLFSYYAEAPFIFIEYFQLSPSMYGFLGIVVASASIIGAKVSKRLLATYKPEKIIYIGCLVMTGSYPFNCYYSIGIKSKHNIYDWIFNSDVYIAIRNRSSAT